jgi:hypothetical protein
MMAKLETNNISYSNLNEIKIHQRPDMDTFIKSKL